MEYGFTHVTTWQNFSFTGVCARAKYTIGIYEFSYVFFSSPVGWRLTRKISILPDTLIIMDYSRRFFMCLQLMVSVIREGEVWIFLTILCSRVLLWRSWAVRGGVKLWHPNGHKIPEKHMVMWLLHFPGLFDPFMREKESFSFSKDVLNWLLISDFPASENCFWHYCRGRKIEQRQISRIDSRWMVC